MEIQQYHIPAKHPHQTKANYLRENKNFFIGLWAGGKIWPEISEIIYEQRGITITPQNFYDVLNEHVTKEDRMKNLMNKPK